MKMPCSPHEVLWSEHLQKFVYTLFASGNICQSLNFVLKDIEHFLSYSPGRGESFTLNRYSVEITLID